MAEPFTKSDTRSGATRACPILHLLQIIVRSVLLLKPQTLTDVLSAKEPGYRASRGSRNDHGGLPGFGPNH